MYDLNGKTALVTGAADATASAAPSPPASPPKEPTSW